MNELNPNGVWPVMLTPFKDDGEVDYPALRELTSWYIEKGVVGLFSCAQSSEMFFLSDAESQKITKTVKEVAGDEIPVISSGHTANSLEQQAEQIKNIYAAGADVVILITNRLAKQSESDEVWLANLKRLLTMIPDNIPLGFYECPYPYKRMMSLENLKWAAGTGRFYFLKDTCCDAQLIKQRVDATKGSHLKIFNANTTTLVETVKYGASGYSGVMANFHPDIYKWVVEHLDDDKIDEINSFISIASLIERQVYPVNAKYYLKHYEGLSLTDNSRTQDNTLLDQTAIDEINNLDIMTKVYKNKIKGA